VAARPVARGRRPEQRHHGHNGVTTDVAIAVLEAAAQGCRAGLSLRAALDDAGARRGVLGWTVAGAPASAPGHDADVALAHQAIVIADRFGGQVAWCLDRTATTLRERNALRAEQHTHTAQARLSARVLTWTPIVMTAGSCLLSTSARTVVLTTPLGWTCVLIGLALNGIGSWWMAALVRRAS
jgi:hypothetical protein